MFLIRRDPLTFRLITVVIKAISQVPDYWHRTLFWLDMDSRSKFQLALAFIALHSFVAAGPCDIYADGNTPCVAAHSTTRALFDNYSGPLYQVQRSSDGTTAEISPQSTGGIADAASQDTFCDGTNCVISVIYDQTGNGNDLTQAPPGGFDGPESGGYDSLADATAAPVTVGGQKAYGEALLDVFS